MLPDVIDNHAVHLLLEGRFSDPFSLLGMHTLPQKGLRICAFFPDAKQVIAINKKDYQQTFTLINYKESGFFYQIMEDEFETFSYIYQVTWDNGYKQLMDDPYNFGTLLSDFDSYLLKEGTHLRPYQQLGSRNITLGGVDGSSFAVWAPNAKAVSVVGEFNFWEHRRNPMRFRQESGVWELFIPGKVNGNLYKYHIIDNQGISRFKADPYGVSYQLRPDTATQVANIPNPSHYRESSSKSPSFSKPVSIYEVHLGSWMRNESHQWLSYDELAERLIPYVKEMGFTHIELLPITEHPFDGSWGYQPTGIYAPTRRFGDPQAFKRFIDKAHQAELKVILDWVPAHFPKDESGLVRFDGTALYEYANPLEAEHQDWGTLIYNYKRYEVQNYLIGNALYWLECYELDGLRVDAVSSMIYRDYSRPQGQWIPNEYGGHQNLEAIDFLQKTNQVVNRECPGIMMIAEESTDFSGVTRPVDHGGLGFHYKWNMGWMHDTLRYMQLDPIYRQYHHQLMTFGLLYTYNENFVLPISHDEVVHGKGSLLNKMSGDTWQKFASLRAYFGFMWAYPGKKLLFMGSEFAQWNEWDHDSQLSWHLLKQAEHKGVQQLVKDLNHCYKKQLPLYQCDHSDCGFEWLVVDDFQNSVFVFVRKDNYGNEIIVVSNFTPVMRNDYRFGVNYSGRYRELINTDSSYYGGSNQGNHGSLIALSEPSHGKPYSLCLSLPPLSTLYLMKESADG